MSALTIVMCSITALIDGHLRIHINICTYYITLGCDALNCCIFNICYPSLWGYGILKSVCPTYDKSSNKHIEFTFGILHVINDRLGAA